MRSHLAAADDPVAPIGSAVERRRGPRRRRNARSGASPMSSESRIATPAAAASSVTRSSTRHIGVRSMVQEVHRDLDAAHRLPAGCRAPGPPAGRRRAPGCARAIRRASARSSVSSWMFQAIRNGRAPTTVAPAVGCGRRGPKSGAPSRSRERRREALEPGPSDVREDTPVGSRRGARVQVDGQLVAFGQPRPERRGRARRRSSMRRVAERHEGHDIERADARVLAVLASHVDARDRLRREALASRP